MKQEPCYLNDNFPFAGLTIGQAKELIREIVATEIAKILPKPTKESHPDTLNIDQAITLLRENGYKVTKHMIYRLSSAHEIPCGRFGRQLIFDRKQLLDWVESKTIRKSGNSIQTAK